MELTTKERARAAADRAKAIDILAAQGRHRPAMHKRDADWATIGDVRQELTEAFAQYDRHRREIAWPRRLRRRVARWIRSLAGLVPRSIELPPRVD